MHSRTAILFVSFVSFFLVACPDALAQDCGTVVAGPVNGTWTLAGSPYCVVGDLRISGLSIEPGVRVEVDGPHEIRVLTGLHAQGTANQPIVFTAKDPKVRWKGILFERTPAVSSLIHCRLELAHESAARLFGGTVVIRDCVFENNVSQGEGGAIEAMMEDLDLVIRNCQFLQNIAKASGGALAATFGEGRLVLDNCLFSHNLSNPSLAVPGRMLFDTQGGAMNIDGDAVIRNCVIEHNTCIARNSSGVANATGGGIYITNGELTLENCLIRNNDARSTIVGERGGAISQGGGVYQNNGDLVAINTLITCNTATPQGVGAEISEGGGLYVNSGNCYLENCTIAGNTDGGVHRAGGTVSALNSIIYGNNGPSVVGTIDATYCCIESTDPHPGEGNINGSPLFAGSGCECTDFRLGAGSPAIDAGNPDPSFGDSCFPPAEGTARNDMGAFGGPLACRWEPSCDGPGVPRVLLVQLSMLDADLSAGEMLEVSPSVDNGPEPYVVDAYLWVKSPSGIVTSFLKNRGITVRPLFNFTRTYQVERAGAGILSEPGTYTFGIRLVDTKTGFNLTNSLETFVVTP